MPINAIAIDDNASTLTLLDSYAAKTPNINSLTTFTSPLEALTYLDSNEVNLALIDVHMPDISGLDFISIAKRRADSSLLKFIVISAHKEYAVDGFELEVIDYLLKPFGLDRFLMAVNKAYDTQDLPYKNEVKEECIFARQGTKYIKVEPSSVLYVESKGHFVYLFFPDDTPLILSDGISRMEKLLAPYGFFRVHKKYLVNKHHIKEVDSTSVAIDRTEGTLPIGRKYKGFISRIAS